MNKLVLVGSLTAALSLSWLAAPTDAQASCRTHKRAGTIIGAAGGALVGNSLWHGGGGAVVGGLGGAVAGHELTKDSGGCRRSASHRHARQSAQRQRPAYYDERGNPVYSR